MREIEGGWRERDEESERRGAHVQTIHADCSPARWSYYRVSPRLLPLSLRPSSHVLPDRQLFSERLIERTLEETKPTTPLWNRNCWTQLIFLLTPFFFFFPFVLAPVRLFYSCKNPVSFSMFLHTFWRDRRTEKMRIILFSWHFLGVYSVVWGLATGAFPSSVQIGELERLPVFTHGSLTPCSQYWILAHSSHQRKCEPAQFQTEIKLWIHY